MSAEHRWCVWRGDVALGWRQLALVQAPDAAEALRRLRGRNRRLEAVELLALRPGEQPPSQQGEALGSSVCG